jgi:hypothetical protein
MTDTSERACGEADRKAAVLEASAGAAQLRNLRCSEGSARRGRNAHSTAFPLID